MAGVADAVDDYERQAVARAFLLTDSLAAHPDHVDLLATRFRLAPEERLDQQHQPVDGEWQVTSGQLRRVGGGPTPVASIRTVQRPSPFRRAATGIGRGRRTPARSRGARR